MQGDLQQGMSHSVGAVGYGLGTLLADTNFTSVFPLLAAPILIVSIGSAPYVIELQEGAAPLFDALTPVSDVLVELIQGT